LTLSRRLELEFGVIGIRCEFDGLNPSALLQLTASPWTTEARTRERWQFRAL